MKKLEIKPWKVKEAFSRILPKSNSTQENTQKDPSHKFPFPKFPIPFQKQLPDFKSLRSKLIKLTSATQVGKAMTNWKIGTKILFGYLLILTFLFSVGGYCLLSLHNLSQQYEEVLSVNIPAIQAVDGLEKGVLAVDNSIKTFILTKDPNTIVEAEQHKQKMVEWIAASRNYALTPEQQEDAEGLRRNYEDYEAAIWLAFSKAQAGDQPEAQAIMATAVNESKNKLLGNSQTLVESNSKAMEKAAVKVGQIRNWTLVITLIIFFLSIIAGAFMGVYLPVSIVKPINDLVTSSKKIAEGDLTGTITVFSKDEIGELSQVFNQMTQNLKSLLQEVKLNADQIAFSSEQLGIITHENSAVANQIAQNIQGIAYSAEDADQAVATVSSSITQMSASIQQIASNAQTVTTVSQKASECAQLGDQDLHNAIKQMNSLSSTVNKSALIIQDLGEHSQAIGQITDVITSIADQTNLLSLNASIEAARAGNSGRGFAVVAQEVKKLADQSAQSAKEITKLIKKIQLKTNQAIEAMQTGTKEALQGMQVMEHADKSFQKVLAAVENVTKQIEDVSRSAEEISQSTNQVVEAVTKISQTTEQVAENAQNIAAATEEQTASVEQVAGATQSLSGMADSLREQVSKFKISGFECNEAKPAVPEKSTDEAVV